MLGLELVYKEGILSTDNYVRLSVIFVEYDKLLIS